MDTTGIADDVVSILTNVSHHFIPLAAIAGEQSSRRGRAEFARAVTTTHQIALYLATMEGICHFCTIQLGHIIKMIGLRLVIM